MTARLPELLALVEAELGMEAALRLVAAHGGRRIYIAKSPRQDAKLAQSLGLPLARLLAAHYGGEFIEVPNGRLALGDAAARLRAVAESGASSNRLAGQLGITRRRVLQIRARLAEDGDGGQGDMFHREKSRRSEG